MKKGRKGPGVREKSQKQPGAKAVPTDDKKRMHPLAKKRRYVGGSTTGTQKSVRKRDANLVRPPGGASGTRIQGD